MLEWLDRPVFTLLGVHVTIGAIVLVVVLVWYFKTHKR